MAGLNKERWEAVSPHLDRALELTGEARETMVASLRANFPRVAEDLEALLAAQGSPDVEAFLESPPERPAASLAGQVVGAYTLIAPIGQGGMGSVWLARRSDGRFEGQAAVKLLNASLVGRTGEERFRREGNILARLTHPHIARLIDAGVSPAGQPYLVLEHVEGEPIDRYCDGRRLDVPARLRLFQDVLSAVAHAHANLIVHRDIKPSNVLVGVEGQVKLLDFGIAKLLEGEGEGGEATALTREGGSALTPEYAAPEQITGGAVTTATDVYALGTLLYELLTGRHPAEAALGSTAELVKAIVDTDPQRISESVTRSPETRERNAAARGTTPDALRRVLKGDLDVIVARALKKKPEERYASVTALADDIERYLHDEPIGARPDTLAYRAAKFVRRHTAGVAAATAATLILAGLVGFYTLRLAKERDRARFEAEKATKVSELLTDLLSGADPFRQGKEQTVRELLDAGATRVEKELTDQPELQAEMLAVIGRIYRRLGLHEKAVSLLEKSVATGRRASGPEHERVLAESLAELGIVQRRKGDPAAAAPALEESLAIRRKVLGPEHPDVADNLVELGRVYGDLGSDEKAEPLLREALAIRRKVLGELDHDTGVSMSDLALVLRRRGDLSGAESLFRQVLVIYRKADGDEHPHVAAMLFNLAQTAAEEDNYQGSELLFRQCIAMDRKGLGENHPDLAVDLVHFSKTLLELGKYEEAASVAREGLRITEATSGKDHPLIAFGEIYLAEIDLAQNDAAGAEPLLRDALRIRQRTFRPDDWRIGVCKSTLGAALTALGRYDEAEPLLRDAQRVLKEVPGAQAQEAKANTLRLAALAEARGRVVAR